MFYLFNTIFRDIHEFIEPGFIEKAMTGTFNGTQITEQLLLLGGFVAEVPIAMVLLSRLLPYGANRWANMIAAVITLAFEINNGTTDLDDTFHMVIEMAALCFIIWSAWRWRNPAPKHYSTRQEA
jgi:Sec-independent protein secretion pathway component TatC